MVCKKEEEKMIRKQHIQNFFLIFILMGSFLVSQWHILDAQVHGHDSACQECLHGQNLQSQEAVVATLVPFENGTVSSVVLTSDSQIDPVVFLQYQSRAPPV